MPDQFCGQKTPRSAATTLAGSRPLRHLSDNAARGVTFRSFVRPSLHEKSHPSSRIERLFHLARVTAVSLLYSERLTVEENQPWRLVRAYIWVLDELAENSTSLSSHSWNDVGRKVDSLSVRFNTKISLHMMLPNVDPKSDLFRKKIVFAWGLKMATIVVSRREKNN